MNLEWEFDNPAITLEKYYEGSVEFVKKRMENDVLIEELSSKKSELNSKKIQIEKLKDKISKMGDYIQDDIESTIEKVSDNAKLKLDKETIKFSSQKEELLKHKELDLKENDIWLEKRIEELLSKSESKNENLSEIEEKALAFEISRRTFNINSDEKINQYQDAIIQEQLNCQTEIGQLKNEQDTIYNKYEPDIDKYKHIIDEISKKYQPDIQIFQNTVAEKIAIRNNEIEKLKNEGEIAIKLANDEIDDYKQQYRKTEKQFNEQIRMAKIQKKPFTRMENSKISRLNSINDQIQKVNNRVNRKISSINQKIQEALSKHNQIIEKAESQLESIIKTRDNELKEPNEIYNNFLKERDIQITDIQSKINQREDDRNITIRQLSSKIDNEKQEQANHSANIDEEIIDYVMQGDTCLSDVLNESSAPFDNLKSRISTWQQMIVNIKKQKTEYSYQKEHEKQKSALSSKTFEQLKNDLDEASNYKDQLSIFAKNNTIFVIIGCISVTIGLLLSLVIRKVSYISVSEIGFFITIIGIFLAVFSTLKSKKEFELICKYISLASDYKTFPSIAEHSIKVTKKRELEKMKVMGNKLYDVHYGRTEAKNIHDAKDADIKADYERNLKLITKEFENVKEQIERERDLEIKKIKSDAYESENNFIIEKNNLQSNIDTLRTNINFISGRIDELNTEINTNVEYLNAFEDNCNELEKQMQNDKWLAPMSFTHGKLSNTIYIIPENGEKDVFGHKKIYRVDHNKKALIINYDISDVEDGKIEQMNNIIHDLIFDLMYSIYRMNSKDLYMQYVVDEMSCTNDLKNTNVKNAFNIGEVVGKLDDIKARLKIFAMQRERLAEKGISIDLLNENRYNEQDRPEQYNIVYIIYKPNERKSKLDDEIRMLIPECDKYGFLPIFICEKDTWEREIQEKESMYKDIKSLTNNAVIIFDGKTYKMSI